MVVMTVIVNNVFIGRLEAEVVSGNLNNLDKVRMTLDEQLDRVNHMANQMLLNENQFALYRTSDHQGYKAWGIVSELKSYGKGSPFIKEIWLYYRGESSIYTSGSVYTLSTFIEQVYPFEEWPAEQMHADLNQSTQPIVRPPSVYANGTDRLGHIVIPILPYFEQPYATLVFQFRASSIEQLLTNQVNTGGSTWVLDREQRLIAGTGPESGELAEAVAELVTLDSNSSNREVSLDGERYYLFTQASAEYGWTYATLLPVGHVLEQVWQAQRLYLIGTLILVAIGALMIYLSMKWNYQPIRRLRLETEPLLPKDSTHLNDLDTVRHVLGGLVQENRRLDERARLHIGKARQQWLLTLLKGQVVSDDELQLYGDEIGIPLTDRLFRVAIVAWSPYHSEHAEPVSAEVLEQQIPREMTGFAMEHLDRNRSIVLFVVDRSEEEAFLLILSNWRQRLENMGKTGQLVTIGVGSTTELDDIPRSYLEADSAISYRFIAGNNRVIAFSDIPQEQGREEIYPYREIQTLQESIRTGQAAKVEKSLQAMLSFIRTTQPPLIAARALCYDIISSINKVWAEMGVADQSYTPYPDVFSLERIETLDRFEQVILSVCKDVCDSLVPTVKSVPETRSIEQMEAYIQENYRNCEFSLQEMSGVFGMAMSNMSQYFKDQTGRTLLDYMTDLRIRTAQELLVQETMPVKEVAESVGYYNVSSFIRRFKQFTGKTPGEYRNEQQI